MDCYLQRVQLTVQRVLQGEVREGDADRVPLLAGQGPDAQRVVGVEVGVGRGRDLAPLAAQLTPAVPESCNAMAKRTCHSKWKVGDAPFQRQGQ